MNINNVIKTLRQSQKLQAVSVYYSQALGFEILIRIEPNTKYMCQASQSALEKNDYQVLEVQIPRMPFVLKY